MAPSSPSLICLERPREKPTLLDEQDDELFDAAPSQGGNLNFGTASPLLPALSLSRTESIRTNSFSSTSDAGFGIGIPRDPLRVGRGGSTANQRFDGQLHYDGKGRSSAPAGSKAFAQSSPGPPTPTFLIQIPGGGTHVFRGPETLEARAQPHKRRRGSSKPRIISGDRAPLRSLHQLPSSRTPILGSKAALKASAPVFTPRHTPLPSPGRTAPRYSHPYVRTPPFSPPSSPTASPLDSSLSAEISDLGIVQTSPNRLRDFFAHKYESFPFPVIDFPKPRPPKIFLGHRRKAPGVVAPDSADPRTALAPAPASTSPPKRKRPQLEEPFTPAKKLSVVVQSGRYAVYSSDASSSDNVEYDGPSDSGASLDGLEVCRTEDLLGLGSPEILGPIYARSWESYSASDEASDSEADHIAAVSASRRKMSTGRGMEDTEEVRLQLGSSLSISQSSGLATFEKSGAFDRLMATPSPRALLARTWNDAGRSSLERSILRSWIACDVPSEKLAAIKKFCDRLGNVLNRRFASGSSARQHRRFVVDVFGSVAWGGQTGSSGDLDLIVRIDHPNFWRVAPSDDAQVTSSRRAIRSMTPNPKLDEIYGLRSVVRTLWQQRFREVVGIYGANTPIVKFKTDAPGGGEMECDLNINDLGGWYNSRLILAYCEISPYVLRPLIHALKLWASTQEVNDPSGQKSPPSMSSYCLTLMAIAYLQHIGMLPNLQAGIEFKLPDRPEEGGKDIVWVGLGKEQGTKCHTGFSPTPPPAWQPLNPRMTVDEALRGFFSFFSRDAATEGGFDGKTHVVSILNGGILRRPHPLVPEGHVFSKEEVIIREMCIGRGDLGLQPKNWTDRRFVVQDPFIWQKNCAGAMAKAGLDRWWDAVDHANAKLTSLGDAARLEDILVSFAPLPIRRGASPATPDGVGRGRGGRGRGSPAPRASPRGRGLWRGV